MRRRPRTQVVALPLVLVAAALWVRPAPSRLTPAPSPEIEPTLPATLDLLVLPADAPPGEPPRLQVTLATSEDLQDVVLTPVLPEGVKSEAGVLPASQGASLRAQETRVYVVPLQVTHAGAYPLRLDATFRLPDGTVLHTQQGTMWMNGVTAPEGLHHAGAYEWMGVQVGEPQP